MKHIKDRVDCMPHKMQVRGLYGVGAVSTTIVGPIAVTVTVAR